MANELQVFNLTSGSTYYAVVLNEAGEYWNGGTSAFEAYNASHWTNYAVSSETANSAGDWLGDFPTGITTAGTYSVQVRLRAGGSAAITDTTVADGTIQWDGTQEDLPDADYEGRYTTSTKLNTFLGTLNLDDYADTDNDDARDAGAVEQGIVTAEARVDLYTFGPYTFSDDTNGEVAAAVFERWARVLASFELYARRVPNDNDAGKALTQWYKEAIEEMKAFAGDELELPGAVPANGDPLDDSMTLDAPIAVGPTVNPDGTNINTPYPYLGYADGRLTYG